jgi:hypothetical protein
MLERKREMFSKHLPNCVLFRDAGESSAGLETP